MVRRLLQALVRLFRPPAREPNRRGLNLPLAPTPENGPALAARIVEVTKQLDEVQLDYSPESLKWVDQRILQFRGEGQTFNDVGETVFLFGCYAGEVFARSLPGRWAEPTEPEVAMGLSMMGIRTEDDRFWNPIGKSIRLLENGPTESLHYLWQVARNASERSAA
jgi:hypothetical protein